MSSVCRLSCVALLLVVVFVAGQEFARDNELPTAPDFRPEIFYDNKVLPENREVTVFLFKHEPTRLFFLHEKNQRPLSITVTPCSASIDWTLTLRDFPSVSRTRNKGFWIPYQSPTPAFYSGPTRRTHSEQRALAGLYVLEMTSGHWDTSVKVFVSTAPEGQSPYPPLPVDPQVEVLRVRRGRVLIAWKASPSPDKVEYWVASNPRKNYPSLCALYSDLHGDIPDPPPPSSGFGFLWEKETRRRHLVRAKEIERNFEPKNNVEIHSVGTKTWHVFHDLDDGQQRFLDVFVVDPVRNTSTGYVGTSVAARGQLAGTKIKENAVVPISQTPEVLEYTLPAPTHALWVFLQSCSGHGPLHLTVTQGDRDLMTSDVMDARSLLLLDPPNGTLQLTVSSKVRGPRTAILWVSRKYHKYPFPTLPDNKRVQVFDTLTTCDSVTLAWRATLDDKVRYCLYRRHIKKAVKWHVAKPPHQLCQETEGGATHDDDDKVKILCRRYHRFSRNRFNDVIVQRVHGLHPDSTYVFEVQVTKFRGKMLPYEQVWVSTRKACPQVRSKR